MKDVRPTNYNMETIILVHGCAYAIITVHDSRKTHSIIGQPFWSSTLDLTINSTKKSWFDNFFYDK